MQGARSGHDLFRDCLVLPPAQAENQRQASRLAQWCALNLDQSWVGVAPWDPVSSQTWRMSKTHAPQGFTSSSKLPSFNPGSLTVELHLSLTAPYPAPHHHRGSQYLAQTAQAVIFAAQRRWKNRPLIGCGKTLARAWGPDRRRRPC